MTEIAWQYSRNQRRHWLDDGTEKNYRVRFEIKDCRPYGSIHLPEHGYDLYCYGKKIEHAKTVKELKLKAKAIYDSERTNGKATARVRAVAKGS